MSDDDSTPDEGEDLILMSFEGEWVDLINRLGGQHGRNPQELVSFALRHLDTENENTIVVSLADDLARLVRRMGAQMSATPHETIVFALHHLEQLLSITVDEPVVIRRRKDGQIDVGTLLHDPSQQEYEQTPAQDEGNHPWSDLLRHPQIDTMDIYVPLRQEWVKATDLIGQVSGDQVVHWRLRPT